MALDAGAKVTVMSGVGQAVPDEMNRIGMHSMPYARIQTSAEFKRNQCRRVFICCFKCDYQRPPPPPPRDRPPPKLLLLLEELLRLRREDLLDLELPLPKPELLSLSGRRGVR